MTDRDVIAWARAFAEDTAETATPTSLHRVAVAANLRRLADLAEKGASGWQPIATAPLDTRVLLLNDEGYVFTGEVYDGIGPLDDQGCRREAT
jgi:hypothetical protein